MKLIAIALPIVILGMGVWIFAILNSTPSTGTETDTLPPTVTERETVTPPAAPVEDISAVDQKSSIAFTYPATLAPYYVEATPWPPTFISSGGSYNCEVSEQMTAMSGYTSREEVYNGTNYCIWERPAEAADSRSTDYQITFPEADQYLTLGFTLRGVPCSNYPAPEAGYCQIQQVKFNLLEFIDPIARSARLPQ